jgi:hypothetical protein
MGLILEPVCVLLTWCRLLISGGAYVGGIIFENENEKEKENDGGLF